MTASIYDQVHAERYDHTNQEAPVTNKLAAIEADFRDDSAHLIASVRGFLDAHASTLASEAAKVQSSLSAQAVEAAFLPPGADAWLSRFIAEFAVWAPKAFPPAPLTDDQGAESHAALSGTETQPGEPDLTGYAPSGGLSAAGTAM